MKGSKPLYNEKMRTRSFQLAEKHYDDLEDISELLGEVGISAAFRWVLSKFGEVGKEFLRRKAKEENEKLFNLIEGSR
jgi:hypothetical protein